MTERKNIIILKQGDAFETWGSLTEVCAARGLSYNYLKRQKFPFTHKGIQFHKVPFKTINNVINNS